MEDKNFLIKVKLKSLFETSKKCRKETGKINSKIFLEIVSEGI